MGKGKSPRKRREPGRQPSAEEPEPERQTQERVDLVPPARRPPTALGAETPPLPPREPRSRPAALERARPALSRLVQGLRTALGAMLDIADVAADAITRGLQRRA